MDAGIRQRNYQRLYVMNTLIIIRSIKNSSYYDKHKMYFPFSVFYQYVESISSVFSNEVMRKNLGKYKKK